MKLNLYKVSLQCAPMLFGIILIVCCWWLFVIHSCMLGLNTRLQAMLANTLLDSLTVSLPYFILPRKWRVGVWGVMPLLGLLFEVNALYFRNFGTIPGLSALFTGDAFNVFTVAGVLHSFVYADLALLLPFIVTLAAWLWFGKERICSRQFPSTYRVIALLALLASPFARIALDVRRKWLWYKEVAPIVENALVYYKVEYQENSRLALIYELEDKGFCPYIGKAVMSAFPKTLNLNEDNLQEIGNYLRKSSRQTLAQSARTKNLVLVIVESWNTSTLDYKDVTPYVNHLMETPGTLSARNLYVQIGAGGSSDGQFMLTTGLLPIKDEALVANYAETSYPSLPKYLEGYQCVEVIGEDSRVWNHHLTNKSYGYNDIVSNVSGSRIDSDSLIFRRAAEVADSLPQPFMLTVTTLTMHGPYAKPNTSTPYDGAGAVNLDVCDRNFLAATKHFDRQLSLFVDSLKAKGLFDNTVIVITGDHCTRPMDTSEAMACTTVPLIIVNAGITREISERANQIDVFPTLLDVMGVESRYRGVGRSLIADSVPQATPAEAWRISELIIRSRLGAKILENL